VDAPLTRDMELQGPQGVTYEDEEFQGVVEAFDTLQTNEPETVLSATVQRLRGRLAVVMAVRGTHTELQGRANEWLGLLGANGSKVGYEWSIGH